MNTDLQAQAADVLRRLALDESLKERTMADAATAALARKVAARYIGGETIDDAFARLPSIFARGHKASIEYTGESVRDPELANAETDVFVELAERIGTSGVDSTVSFDLSHIGLVIDPEQCFRNVVRLAETTERAGAELIISAEASDRTDLVLDMHARLAERFTHVGITVQARLHRTAKDLAALLDRPGRIRLVKGAFLEAESVATRAVVPNCAARISTTQPESSNRATRFPSRRMTATSSKHYAPSMIRSSEPTTWSSRCCSVSVPSNWTHSEPRASPHANTSSSEHSGGCTYSIASPKSRSVSTPRSSTPRLPPLQTDPQQHKWGCTRIECSPLVYVSSSPETP